MNLNFLRRIKFDGKLFIINRIVARTPSHSLRLAYYRKVLRYEIGPNSFIFMDAWFDNTTDFRMGKDSTINQRCRLDNRGGIEIGDSVSISAEVCILSADHDIQSRDFAGRQKRVVVQDYVFIGTRAMILPGVTIGRGAVVAAGSVVTRDVPPYAVVAGIPARQISTRTADLEYSAAYTRLFA